MDGADGSPPQSLCMIRAAELFPKPQMEKEDIQLTVPFQELAGESVKYLGRTDDGVLALSNYRLFLLKHSTNSDTSVPLGLIESAQPRDLFHLIVSCKDASTVRCSFETAEQCSEWQRRIQLSVGVPENLESLFAFPFCSWACDGITNGSTTQHNIGANFNNSGSIGAENSLSFVCAASDGAERFQRVSRYDDDFMLEVERLGFDLNGPWRISNTNEDFKLCPSYPQKILVPCCISDDTLHTVANFRGSRRLPAVVWRHRKSGAVIARCSQPEVGWLGWRNSKDEQLLKALADACAFDRGEQMRRVTQLPPNSQMMMLSNESAPPSPDSSHEEVALDEVRKILIVDARSYTSAVTNRARGGGCECIEYYPCAEIEFMNLGNIHAIRRSFHALRQLCASPPDIPNWLGLLEKTMWLQHLSGLLAASMTVCHAIEKKGRPVLVHCSDGWDRTPQIVATAELCLDPFYRTVEGFRILVEREWLSYGHKFADRCGHGPGSDELNERCPVFLQWLDLVHQIHKQYPCSFEFSIGYLIKLAQHSLSCLFGTFLCNTLKERIENSIFERTFSVWPFLSGTIYRNPLYVPSREKVLWPAYNVRDLSLWTEVYLGSLGNDNGIEFGANNADGVHGSINPMTKTRSYGDLINTAHMQNGISRRSSDPNMTVDPNLTVATSSEDNSVADIQSEREDSPDIANLIQDTTKMLQNLTIELNNHEDESFKFTSTHQQRQSAARDKNEETNSVDLRECAEQMIKESLLHRQEQTSNTLRNIDGDKPATNTIINDDSLCQSSLQINHRNEIGCEQNSTSSCTTLQTLTTCATSSVPTVVAFECEQENGLDKSLETVNDIDNGCVERNGSFDDHDITINKKVNLNMELFQSIDLAVDLDVKRCKSATAYTFAADTDADADNSDSVVQQNMWHGSVNTSTDTLVPIESKQQKFSTNDTEICATTEDECDAADKRCAFPSNNGLSDLTATKYEALGNDFKSYSSTRRSFNNSINCSILPNVHNNDRSNNVFSTSSSNTSVSSTSSLTNLSRANKTTNQNNHNNNNNESERESTQINHPPPPSQFISNVVGSAAQMDESILILPEHQKLDISVSGKCEAVINNVAYATAAKVATSSSLPTFNSSSHPYAHYATAQRRRRTSSSNSRREGLFAKQVNGSATSRFSLPGLRSLPMTPPSLPERPQIAISCPDGLAHALSEQNMRLQQIVQEHKLREDVLLREIHDMRMALLKKICPNCNNAPATHDEQCYVADNIENASVCSWEAVDDRSGPSSSTSSSVQPNVSSVLWVPDHAVSRCTGCQTEFWLGRRKHHCRSCGQIFCADCSEFWAPLPDEKLFSPVRLCGACYHSVTTRMQMSQFQNGAGTLLQLQQNATKSMTSNAIATTAPAPAATSKA